MKRAHGEAFDETGASGADFRWSRLNRCTDGPRSEWHSAAGWLRNWAGEVCAQLELLSSGSGPVIRTGYKPEAWMN